MANFPQLHACAHGRELIVTDSNTVVGTVRAWRGLAFPVVAFGVWRLAHLLALALLGAAPLAPTFAWDAHWYLRIMRAGYLPWAESGATQATAFFPLVPWLARAVEGLLGSEEAAMLVVANAAALVAVVLVYVAVRAWRDERVARAGLVILLLYPSSLFLWMFYTEAAFIALSALVLIACRRDRPLLAGAFSAPLAMTRIPGILIVPAALAALIERRRRPAPTWIALLLAGLGLGAVMAAQGFEAGNPLAFVHAGSPWLRGLAPPWVAVADGVRRTLRHRWLVSVALADLLSLLLVVAGAALAAARRWPAAATAWIVLMAGTILCSGSSTSSARYVLAAWPAFGVLAETGLALPRALRWAVLAALGAASFTFLALAGVGHFVG